jgi:hypothetical protein
MRRLLLSLALLAACADDVAAPPPAPDAGDPAAPALENGPYDVVVEVPAAEAYGERTFVVPARTNWVNTGLFLARGQVARIDAAGRWSLDGREMGPEGHAPLGDERKCPVGSLVARSGLDFEGEISCIGRGADFTAPRDDVVYVGMVLSTDLGETYATRLRADGALSVTVQSDGATVPTLPAARATDYDFAFVRSGRVELAGRHVSVSLTAAQAERDKATAAAAVEALDRIYEAEADLRGMTPFSGQRVRFIADEVVERNGWYMLAGNPVRCVPALLGGSDTQRILRAGEAEVDIWGFAHELGHVFGFANGAWVYQILNLESWPNVFTLHALTTLSRTAHQPNVDTYCRGKDAYLAAGAYKTLRDDPFLQLCFLMEFTGAYGWPFWQRFFAGMNGQTNADVGYDGADEDRSVWSYVRDRFSLAAGEDVTPLFRRWRVPVRALD